MTHRTGTTRALLVIVAVVCLLGLRWWAGTNAPEGAPPSAPSAESAGPESPRSEGTPGGAVSMPAGDRRDLSVDESLGGHTLERHVGKTDEELADRLRREPGISAASTYTDRETAERVVAGTLATSVLRIEAWRRRTGSRPNLALDYRGTPGAIIGRMLRRGTRASVRATDAVVVLRWNDRRGEEYVLTSYPEARR